MSNVRALRYICVTNIVRIKFLYIVMVVLVVIRD